ncbi:11963_t:CDS:2, partial [Dentiscutata heterogama]
MCNELNLVVIAYKKQLEINYLNDEEWEVVDNIVELLESILIITKLLFSSSYPTVSDIMKQNNGAVYNSRSKLNKYWSIFEESTTITTILDPSSKLLIFPASDKKDTALTSLRNTIAHYNWAENKYKFLILAKMARNFLSIQGTS